MRGALAVALFILVLIAASDDGRAISPGQRAAVAAGAAGPTLDINLLSGTLDSRVTFSRSGTGWYFNSSGCMTSAAGNTPRFDYNFDAPGSTVLLGMLVEQAATNVVLYDRDLTQTADWTATNMTVAKTATGVDCVADSASTITATANNATILQSITLSSSARFQSAYVQRVAGTGTVYMTMDNSTYTAITVTSAWTRVSIPIQTLANPTVGFKLAISGDAINVDIVQNEASPGAGTTNGTSPIPTTTTSVTRNSESDSVSLSTFSYVQNQGTWVVQEYMVNGNQEYALTVDDGSATSGHTWSALDGRSSGTLMYLSANTINQPFGAATIPAVHRFAVSYAGTVGVSMSMNAYGGGTGNVGGILPQSGNEIAVALTEFEFGQATYGGGNWINGWAQRVRYFPYAMSPGQLQAYSALGGP